MWLLSYCGLCVNVYLSKKPSHCKKVKVKKPSYTGQAQKPGQATDRSRTNQAIVKGHMGGKQVTERLRAKTRPLTGQGQIKARPLLKVIGKKKAMPLKGQGQDECQATVNGQSRVKYIFCAGGCTSYKSQVTIYISVCTLIVLTSWIVRVQT